MHLNSFDLKFQFRISHIQKSMRTSFIYIIQEFILPNDTKFILIKNNTVILSRWRVLSDPQLTQEW